MKDVLDVLGCCLMAILIMLTCAIYAFLASHGPELADAILRAIR
jgi:hypothetical protein